MDSGHEEYYPPQPQPPPPPYLFDPLSQSSFYTNPMKTVRSEPNHTDLGSFAVSPSPAMQVPPALENTKNHSKKRSRASRRAPTTVLTTDTGNFRAMVQEFTGIPAQPPFTSSTFLRTGFDPAPFAQKMPPAPPFFRTSFCSSLTSKWDVDPYPSSNSAIQKFFDISTDDSQRKMGVLEQFGSSQRNDNDGEEGFMRSFNGKYINSMRVSSSDFNGRNEGTNESWICPSDRIFHKIQRK